MRHLIWELPVLIPVFNANSLDPDHAASDLGKLPVFNANSIDPGHVASDLGKLLYANYPFGVFLTKMG